MANNTRSTIITIIITTQLFLETRNGNIRSSGKLSWLLQRGNSEWAQSLTVTVTKTEI